MVGEQADDLGRGFTRASDSAGILTRSASNLGGVLSAFGIAAVTHEIGRFGITSVQTAGRLDQLQRALVNIEGSSESAKIRFESLIEVCSTHFFLNLLFSPFVFWLTHDSLYTCNIENLTHKLQVYPVIFLMPYLYFQNILIDTYCRYSF